MIHWAAAKPFFVICRTAALRFPQSHTFSSSEKSVSASFFLKILQKKHLQYKKSYAILFPMMKKMQYIQFRFTGFYCFMQ